MNKRLKMLVGARIRVMRLERNMTLQTMADELGITPPGVLNIEIGRYVALERVQQAAKLFGVTVDSLMRMEDKSHGE